MPGPSRPLTLLRIAAAVCVVQAAGCGGAAVAPVPAGSAGQQTVFGSTGQTAGSLRGDIYELPDNADKLPDFAALTPTGSVYATTFDVPNRSFTEGFPGVTKRFEWFALRFAGPWQAHSAGKYAFRLTSDDGSRLLIDGKLVVDNDGVHGDTSVSGEVELTAGSHAFELQYFQGPATEISLQLFVTPPGGSEHIWTIAD